MNKLRGECLSEKLDQNTVHNLMDVMGDSFTLVYETFLRDSASHLDSLKAAIESGDYPTVQKIAHSLKGSSANVGALTFSELCKSLETAASDNQAQSVETAYQKVQQNWDELCAFIQQCLTLAD